MMKALVVCLFLEALLATSAIGFLFPRSSPEALKVSSTEKPPALAKLIKNSEDAIRWLGNKTTDKLNDLFKLKNQTLNFSSTSAPVVDSKKHFLAWLKDRFHFRSSSSSEYSEESEEDTSKDSLVLAHRAQDQGFSWGPLEKNLSCHAAAVTAELIRSTAEPIPSTAGPLWTVITYLKDEALSLASRSQIFIKEAISSVFARKNPFLTWHCISESIEKRVANFRIRNSSNPGVGTTLECDETVKPTCALNEKKCYTVFQNECKMVQFNYQHGTNFSVYSNDVCIDLFARHPELFYQIPIEQKKRNIE